MAGVETHTTVEYQEEHAGMTLTMRQEQSYHMSPWFVVELEMTVGVSEKVELYVSGDVYNATNVFAAVNKALEFANGS